MLSHKTQVRVRFGDTDPYGIVYFVSYFRYCHRGIEEFLRNLGLPPETMFRNREEKFGLPIVAADCRFLVPARYGELLEVETSVKEIKEKVIVFQFSFYRPPDFTYSRLFFALFAVINTFLVVAMRWAVGAFLARVRRSGRNLRSVLVLGAGELGRQVVRRLQAHRSTASGSSASSTTIRACGTAGSTGFRSWVRRRISSRSFSSTRSIR